MKKIIHYIKWNLRKKIFKFLSKKRYKRIINIKKIDAIGNFTLNRDEKIIISLTSYPRRFECIHLCLKSLLDQTLKPDKIIVWLGSDTKPEQITLKMNELIKYGVEYRFDNKNNLKPHKKYLYAFKEFSSDVVITVDDDVIYSKHLIKELYKTYKKFPNTVCANRVHRVTFNNSEVNKYQNWRFGEDKIKVPSKSLVAIGVGGILYPPLAIPKEALESQKIMELCLSADDLWLKCAELSNGIYVTWSPSMLSYFYEIDEVQDTALKLQNVCQNMNDNYLLNAMNYFKLSAKDFLD